MTRSIASDDVVRRGDAPQYQLGEGPCLDPVRWQETVISQNLAEEARWPEWTPRAVSVLGVKAMMALLLSTSFAYLRRVSQSENRKLIMICHEIDRQDATTVPQ
jgi:hypothetical protein